MGLVCDLGRTVPVLPQRTIIEGDVEVLYLLNSSGQHMPRATNTLEMIQLGELQVSAPIIPWVATYLHSSPAIQQLITDIINGVVVAVGNGSYFETYGIGSSAWILSSADGSSWIEGGGIVPGPKTDLKSYRCELGALLGIGVGAACLKALLPQTPHFMLTACNNLEALRKITVDRAKVKTS